MSDGFSSVSSESSTGETSMSESSDGLIAGGIVDSSSESSSSSTEFFLDVSHADNVAGLDASHVSATIPTLDASYVNG